MDCFVFCGANMYNTLYKNHFILRLFAGKINLEKEDVVGGGVLRKPALFGAAGSNLS